jgi:hypothetical protein
MQHASTTAGIPEFGEVFTEAVFEHLQVSIATSAQLADSKCKLVIFNLRRDVNGRVAHYFVCPPHGEQPQKLSCLKCGVLSGVAVLDPRRPSPPLVPLK